MITMAVGAVIALLAIGYVLHPLLVPGAPCAECGARSGAGARFCGRCGRQLNDG